MLFRVAGIPPPKTLCLVAARDCLPGPDSLGLKVLLRWLFVELTTTLFLSKFTDFLGELSLPSYPKLIGFATLFLSLLFVTRMLSLFVAGIAVFLLCWEFETRLLFPKVEP